MRNDRQLGGFVIVLLFALYIVKCSSCLCQGTVKFDIYYSSEFADDLYMRFDENGTWEMFILKKSFLSGVWEMSDDGRILTVKNCPDVIFGDFDKSKIDELDFLKREANPTKLSNINYTIMDCGSKLDYAEGMPATLILWSNW